MCLVEWDDSEENRMKPVYAGSVLSRCRMSGGSEEVEFSLGNKSGEEPSLGLPELRRRMLGDVEDPKPTPQEPAPPQAPEDDPSPEDVVGLLQQVGERLGRLSIDPDAPQRPPAPVKK